MRQRALTLGHAIPDRREKVAESETVGAGIFVVAFLGLLYLILILGQLRGASQRGDFSIYYACAVAMRRGLDPYAVNLTQLARELGFEPDLFQHPADTPTFTVVTAPLAIVSAPTAYAMWMCASALCLFASLYLLFGPATGLERKSALLFSMCALGFTPLADNFRWAQSQTFVLLGALLFFRWIERGRDSAAGTILAALGLLRGFPLAIGGYLIARRRWRAIGFLALAFAIGAAVTIALIGVAPVGNFLRIIGVIGGHNWFSLDTRWEVAAANVSLDAFITRPLMLMFGAALPYRVDLLSRTTVLALKFAIFGVTCVATARGGGSDRGGRSFALWIATMLILTPVVWLHYLVMLMVSFGLIAVAACHGEVSPPVWRSAIPSYCIIVMVTPLMSTLTFREDIMQWRVSAVAELGFLALLSAWIVAYRFAAEAPPPESSGGFGSSRNGGPAPGSRV